MKSEGVMTRRIPCNAVDDEVTIETYVQAKQSWWENKATFYTQDKDGAYINFIICPAPKKTEAGSETRSK